MRLQNFIKKAFLGFFIIILALVLTGATVVTDYVIYWKSTAESTTVSWDAPAGTVDGYKIVLLWVVGTKILQTYDVGTTTANEFTFDAPRVGHFVVGVSAYNSAGESEFAYSNDETYATVDGNPRAWIITYYLDSPGPIIIN
jgi:hypothetical protein